jgi:AI-2E family transporter
MMDFGDHVRTTGGALKNWAVAQLQDSMAVGVLWLIGLYILHVPLALMWAVMAAVLQIVPHFGPILGLLGPVLGATIKWMDWEHPLGVLVLYAIIALLDGFLLQPYIMRRTAKVPIWASVFTPIVLGVLWPFWGVRALTRCTVCIPGATRKAIGLEPQGRKFTPQSCWSSQRFDPIAEVSELPDHSSSALSS